MIRSTALPPRDARLARVSLLRALVARGLYRPDAQAVAEALFTQAALEPSSRARAEAGGGGARPRGADVSGSA